MTDAGEWWDGLSQRQQLEVWRTCWKPISQGKLLPTSDCSPNSMAVECVQLKEKLGRAGLLKTMHKMELVVQQVGWEIAEKLEQNTPDQSPQG